MFTSMKHFFPRASFLTCSRHLKENCTRKIDEMIGCVSTERHAVLDALFGTNGLITCNDIVSFDFFVTQMQSKELLNVPTAFSDYVLCRIFSTNATKLNVWQQLLDK